MSTGSTDGDAAPRDKLKRLALAGRNRAVVTCANAVMRECADPQVVATAAVVRLAAMLNLNTPVTGVEYREAQDETRAAVEQFPTVALLGRFHAVASTAADRAGDLDGVFSHLLDAEQALMSLTVRGEDDVQALAYLAVASAAADLPEQAVAAVTRAEEHGDRWPHYGSLVGPRLDAALALDHRGDTDACIEQLEEITRIARKRRERGLLTTLDRANHADAVARLNMLGCDTGQNPLLLLPKPDSALQALRDKIVRACHAIGAGQAAKSARFFDTVGLDNPFGAAELLRLRSLAHLAAGDSAAAMGNARKSFLVVSDRQCRMQRLLAQRAAGRADDRQLRANLAAYAAEALTDPLTGLANRRHLDRRLADALASGAQAALGVLDLDRFKQVNTMHGHVVGDQVLQRVAGLLASALRSGDLVARYGGDEFVLVLPDTPLAEAHRIGARACAAIAGARWDDLAPGTQVGASVGWTEITAHRTAQEALAAADQRMYAQKDDQAALAWTAAQKSPALDTDRGRSRRRVTSPR